MTASEILKKPYARKLTPDEAGGYVGTIHEFPGLIAEGETPEETMARLEEAARSWIDAALDLGQRIPEPIEYGDYSGRIALRLPRRLHKLAVERADLENTSLNQLLVTAISFYLGELDGLRFARSALRFEAQSTFSQIAKSSSGLFPEVPVTGMGNTSSSARTVVLTAPETANG